MLELIRKEEKWSSIIEKCDFVDFYHTYSYHQLAKRHDEEPILVCYKDTDKIIAFPMLLRNIDFSTYKDATSVYGYPGPITKNIRSGYDYSPFQKELHQFFHSQKIISVFSRLNPYIPGQKNCLSSLGQMTSPGRVVYIDLTKTLDEQWMLYHKRLRTYINKSRAIYTVKTASTPSHLKTFVKLYHQNMRRVNAKKEYFFDKQYFMDLMNCSDFETELLLAIDNKTGDIAGGTIFTKKDAIVQYHLSGTSEKYMGLNPVKLLIDEIRIRSTRENFKYFNLGGGVGSKEDSLFYFKSGFSKFFRPFNIWKYMVNESIYEDLVQQHKKNEHCQESLHYFPQYRHNR
ncbi:GNAT family N-acetyltransferase [Ulvibacterium marinum]|uniref:GNAT family N-acetyltransferase n=1 Tax=Ulvibacterium marinum TaxID=2419782 RepID=A0A3B0BXP8_9FLAO|nr:GNAT family N-acetyltransferase [Ulvibacterium marinum]RKN76939.1 GNAT family N-acetyltransferase [Ulvibacterium marinum]